MKVLLWLLAALVLIAAALLFVVVQPFAGKGPAWDGPPASAARLEQTVRALIALGPRNDEEGMARAADFLRAQLQILGLVSTTQDYRFDNGLYRNVIVEIGPDTPQRIVLGAHYD